MDREDGSLQLSSLLTAGDWEAELEPEFGKKYFKEIQDFLDKEYANKKEIFPPKHQIFNAFNLSPLKMIKVVILGQDPYHDNGQVPFFPYRKIWQIAPGLSKCDAP